MLSINTLPCIPPGSCFRKLWYHIPGWKKMYQEEILIYRIFCNSICSHEAYWKCILNCPYLGKWTRTIKNYFKILSFKHNDKNFLLVGCNFIYQIFHVLNVYVNCLLHFSLLQLVNSVYFLIQSVNYIKPFIQLLTKDFSISKDISIPKDISSLCSWSVEH